MDGGRERRWQGGDVGLTARMFLVMFLLAAVYLGFLAVLIQSGADTLSLILVAGVMLAAQLFFSDKIALWSIGARVVDARDAPELHALVERLVALADMPKPRIALIATDVPNAFAVGRGPGSAVVAMTYGLLDRLEQPEVEAVLAHELSHIRNRDALVMTLASFFATVAQLMLRSARWNRIGRGRGRQASGVLLIYFASLVVWVISFFLIRALSRYREFAADRGAALLTGAPSQLASALSKISRTMARIPDRDLRDVEGMNAFFIIPASLHGSLGGLFSTHPPTEQRIERLMRLAAEMEQPG